MIIALSPIPYRTFVLTTGTQYVADQYGVIPNVATLADMAALLAAGCTQLYPTPTNLLGKLIGANFNSAADQQIPMFYQGKFRVTGIVGLNTSVPGMNTAVGGIYTAPAKGGSAVVANTQVYTGLTNALTALDLTIALTHLVNPSGSALYFSLTTPQGVAATADLYVYGEIYD